MSPKWISSGNSSHIYTTYVTCAKRCISLSTHNFIAPQLVANISIKLKRKKYASLSISDIWIFAYIRISGCVDRRMCANDMRFDVYVCTNMDGWMCFNYVKNWRVCFARNGGDQRLIKLITGALTYVALWWIDVMLQEEGEIVKNSDRCFLHITLVNGILCKRINVEAQILMVRYTDNFYWCPQTDTVKGKKRRSHFAAFRCLCRHRLTGVYSI